MINDPDCYFARCGHGFNSHTGHILCDDCGLEKNYILIDEINLSSRWKTRYLNGMLVTDILLATIA